jgi:hypothetical protein
MSLPVAPMIDGDEVGDVRGRAAHVHDPNFDIMKTKHAHDPTIRFEEYMYWASITRAEQEVENQKFLASQTHKSLKNHVLAFFGAGRIDAPAGANTPPAAPESPIGDEKKDASSKEAVITGVTPDEWKQASRAIRTAGWGGVFYLITTDILGPFSTP